MRNQSFLWIYSMGISRYTRPIFQAYVSGDIPQKIWPYIWYMQYQSILGSWNSHHVYVWYINIYIYRHNWENDYHQRHQGMFPLNSHWVDNDHQGIIIPLIYGNTQSPRSRNHLLQRPGWGQGFLGQQRAPGGKHWCYRCPEKDVHHLRFSEASVFFWWCLPSCMFAGGIFNGEQWYCSGWSGENQGIQPS